jgi:hypothetical protein
MKPSRHLAASAIFSLALAYWLAWKSLLVLAGGALLDLDRYLWHMLRYGSLELRPAIERFQGRGRIRGGPRFFHSIEFLVLLVAAGFFYRLIWVFALGVVFHVLLDLFVHKKRGRFWFYPDWSHFHCLLYEWLCARVAGAQHVAPSLSDYPSEDDE